MCKALGLEDLAFTSIYEESRVENGRRLLKIERSKQKRNIDSHMGDLELRDKKPYASKGRNSGDSEDENNLLL